MEEKKPIRIRIESPSLQSPQVRLKDPKSLSFFYWLLLLLTFGCAGYSLYLVFTPYLAFTP